MDVVLHLNENATQKSGGICTLRMRFPYTSDMSDASTNAYTHTRFAQLAARYRRRAQR